jgi:hypothetical protein
MNEAQEIDYAYHADRLLLLIARRDKLALDAELISIEDLVRSYRLVRGHESAGCPDSAHPHDVPAILSNAPPPQQR